MLKLKINLKNIYYLDVFKKKIKNTVRTHPYLPLWRGAIFLFRRRCWSYQSEKSPFLPAPCSSAGLVKPRKENLEAFLSEIGHSV